MRKLTFTLLLFIFNSPLFLLDAQSAWAGTSKTAATGTNSSTDWVAMMRDRNVNIHDVQKAFYKWYKKNHKIDNDKPGAAEKTEDEAYEAFKRWEWYNLPRQDVNGNRTDPYKVAADYEDFLNHTTGRSLSRTPLTPSATASWTYAGNTTVPSNSSTGNGGDGRVNRVRIMPGNTSTMFACAPSGGLWKTTNGGTSWSENTDQLGDLSTSDIAINPLKTNIMYLATGDGDGIQSIYPTPATIGILKSYDGGNTWNATSLAYSLSTAGADYYSVNEILIDPVDTSVILAATTFGIWRSANSGATWTQTSTSTWIHSMEFEPGHPSIVYAASSNVILGIGANFYRSTNNGISWTPITSGLPSSTTAEGFEIGVSAADSNDVYVLACNSTDYGYLGLYLSTNHGVSFVTQSTTPDILGWEANGGNDGGQGWYTLSMAVSQTNIDSVWVGGVNIWASSNGGTSWHLNANWEGTPYVHADIHHIQFIPGTNSKGYVVGCDGGVFITSNSGTTWTDLSHNLEIAQQYCIGPSASTAGAWITGWQDNGTNFSTTPWKQVYGGDGMDCFVDWSNNNNYFAETAEGAFEKSTNAGGTWANAAGGITETGPWVTIWLQDPKTSTTLYSGFSNVWKSTNSGGSWTKISTWGGTGGISALAVDSANVSYIFAAQPTKIELTTNGGTSWTNITGTLPVSSTVPIAAIAVSAKTPSHVWVTLGGYSSGNKVFASTNSGTTWTNISSGLPNLPVNCIVSESGSPNGIYVGTDQGVYYHDTILNNWVFYNTGLPLVMIADLKVYKPGKELLAATYGRGTWETPLYSNSSPCTLSATASTLTNINCFGGANGSVSANASGGTAPYTYSWSGGSTTSTESPLSAGVYTITIRDNAGCSATASTIITQPSSAMGITILSSTNINCNNVTGSITVNAATGGTSPYTYSWSPVGGTNLTANNLSAGTYSIIATDNHGCTATASATITQSTALTVSATTTANNTSCSGANGSVSATLSGGTSPYTYSWSGGGSSSTKTGLSAGTYIITLTDKNGCTATSSAIVTQAATLSVSATTTAYPSCFGGANGSVSATTSGGTSPYSYSWTGGNTNSTVTAVSAGTYTITLKDNNGCMATASTIVTQPATALSITIASTVNINCGSISGSITANTATGGLPPYTYSWSPSGGINLTASNLSAGTYTITVTDNHSCSAIASATITQSAALSVSALTTSNNSNCAGNYSGSVSATPSGGTAPYTYSWTGGSTNSSVSILSAGTYTITLTDKNNCTATASAIVTQPPLLGVSFTISSYVTCNSDDDGGVSANSSGGVTPYTYSWSGGSSSSSETGLSAGTYTITLKDNSGCTVSASVVLTQPASVVGISILSIININCNSITGSIIANAATGGTLPYTYSWSPSGGTNLSATGLTTGTYTISVTDNHGCSATASAVITQSLALSVSAATTADNTSCSIANGSVSATPSGGTSPYTYSWSVGNTSSNLSGLSAGTYTVTLTDSNGCIASASTTVTQSSSLSVTANTISNANCTASNGSVSANPSGGTPPYTYSWTGGNTNSTASGLLAGIYTVVLTDNNGCLATSTTTISQSQSTVVITRASVNNILCYGGNGTATANPATSGVSPYTYSWSPGGGSNLATIPIGAGIYTITATDNNGCTATVSATITQPPSPLGINMLSVSNVLCNGGSGTVIANSATGGTSPYTYSWSPSGGTTLTATVTAGTYSILVKDNNGCTASAFATITQATLLTASATTITNESCLGEANGSVTANPSGGTSPYTYSWTGGSTSSTESILSAGTYTVAISDNNGCTATSSTVITQPATSIGISILSVININCTNVTGSIIANAATGGTNPYTYSWSPSGGNNLTAAGLGIGTYTITINDNHGCSATASAAITQSPALSVSAATTANNTSCSNANGSVSATPSGGTSPYTYSWTGGITGSTLSGLSAGTYAVILTDNNGCTATSLTTVNQSVSLNLFASTIANVTCYGGATGQVQVIASGGLSPYTYSWLPNGGSSYLSSNLSAGTYSVTVSDNSGCSNSSTATITQPAAIRDSVNITNPACSATTGSITVGVKGGTAPYTYSWNPGNGSSATVSGLSAGTYTITVKDANSCTSTLSATIVLSHGLSISTVIQNNVSCYGGTNGIAKAGVSGGVLPYTYSWSPGGSTTYIASNLSAGTYTVSITDKNGCSNTAAAIVTQPIAALGGSASIIYPNCMVATGSASIGVSGGTPPYTYTWSPAVSTTSSATGLSIRSYVVSLKDAHGCTASLSLSITQPPVLRDSIVSALTAEVTCGLLNNGAATVGIKYGTQPYTYSWANGSTSARASGLSVGTYSVTVKDANTCSITASVTITQTAGLTIITTIQSNVSCNGGTNGIAKAGVSGGVSPYTYSWNPGGSITYMASNLSAGTYTVSVTDKNGCHGSSTAIVTQPATIRDSLTYINNATCYGGTGSAAIGIKGGTSPYTYTWSPAVSTTSSATGLSARTYVVSIKDAHGCTASLTFSITQPFVVRDSIVKASTVNVLCNGSHTGSATVGVKYGTQPYTYSWNPASGSAATATGLSAGTYTVTVKDRCGNSATATVSITQPNALRDSISSSSCTGGLITATVGVKGGVSPYTYSWSPNVNSTSRASGLSAGTYTITVKDKNGCSIVFTPSLSCGAAPVNPNANNGSTSENDCCPGTEIVKLYPNPTTGQFTIQLTASNTELTLSENSLTIVEIYNMLGRKVMSEEMQKNNTIIDLSSQPNGIYLYRVLNKDGSQVGTGRIILQK